MLTTPEIQAKIAMWRRLAVEGTLTPEQQREAIALLREGRIAASATVRAAKAKKVVLDGDDLIAELGGL